MAKLTRQQIKFVEAYVETGKVVDSARQAGYKQPNVQGSRLLAKDSIKKEVNRLIDERNEEAAWGRKELYAFWIDMCQHAEGDNNRLKASELLAKAEAMFVQKIEDVTNYNDLPEEEVIIAVLLELESRGYRVIPPREGE